MLKSYPYGRILLECKTQDPNALTLSLTPGNGKPGYAFKGKIADTGAILTMDEAHLNRYRIGSPPLELEFLINRRVQLEYVQIKATDTLRFRIGLTNLVFIGTETIPQGTDLFYGKIPLKLGSFEVAVELLASYDDTRKLFDISNDCHVTSCLCGSIASSKIEEIRQLTDALCYLLSFASGYWVAWLYEDYYLDARIALTFLVPSRTTHYNPADNAIDTKAGRELQQYLELGYTNFQRARTDLSLHAVIELYLHSKLANLLEIKYLLLSVALECLKSHAPNYLKSKRKTLTGGTFRELLEDLFKELGVQYDPKELVFIQIRHKIVHTARFPMGEDPVVRYRELVNLSDRAVLSILGYRGKPYLNISNKYAKQPVP